jgi:hypothetical protein
MFGLNRRQQIMLLLFLGLIYAATQYVPPYFYAFQFNDFIRQEVKFAVTARRTTEDVRTHIVEKAQEFNIPITAKDVQITRRGPAFTVDVEYRVPIDLRVYQHELVFRSIESGETFEDASR